MKMRIYCFLALALVPITTAFTAAGEPQKIIRLQPSPAELSDSFGTDWYGVYFQGKKIGYFKVGRFPRGTGEEAHIVETLEMEMKVQSLGQKSESTKTQIVEYEGKPPFRIVRAETVSIDNDVKQKMKLEATPKGVKVTTTTGGQTSTRELPPLDYTLSDSMTSEVWLRRGAKAGEQIVTNDLDFDTLKADKNTIKLLATKSAAIGGFKLSVHDIEAFSHREKITSRSRSNHKGKQLSSKIAELFDLKLEPEHLAKQTQFGADIFMLGMAKIDQPLGNPLKVESLVLTIPTKEASFLPQGPRQRIKVNDDGTVTCELGKKFGQPSKATPKEIEENLADTLAYPIKEAKIQEMAKDAVKDAQTPEEKLKNIVAYTHKLIKPSLKGSIPKLLDLVDRPEGDCKSYALLTTALCRAAGIPSREVGGLLYMGDSIKAFGGHAWNEVVIDGHWVPVDASIPETEINATHLCFGGENDAAGNVLSTLGKLSFRLVEVEKRK